MRPGRVSLPRRHAAGPESNRPMPIMQDSRDADMLGRRTDGSTVRRPLSPHLQAYDMMQLTSALSIAGRITGVAWSLGVLLLVWWLVAAARGAEAYATFAGWATWKWALFLWVPLSWAFWQHLMTGLRHFVMDIGAGFELRTDKFWAVMTMVGSLLLTAAVWAWLIFGRGQ